MLLAALLFPATPLGAQGTLTVYAAASLTEAYNEIGKTFEKVHPGTTVRFNFAGSQVLATQIAQGARADVFASADQRWMEYVEEKGGLASAPVVFARNQLVVVIPESNPGQVSRLHDLARPGVKLVLAGRQVPAGAYAREALSRLRATPGFSKNFDQAVLANLVSEEENVRAVAAKVQLREADAGIVYQTDVTPNLRSQVSLLPIPDPYNPIAEYPMATLKGGNKELGDAFVALVLSAEGQAILKGKGFISPAVP
ncbi:MAG TPA: molybdate ABC transporter substrate-binding protein [Gemmatimonadales bacterium]|nr:molybdate ABC transporter substrate-binding protein [Gemmatimonadales bacterium]